MKTILRAAALLLALAVLAVGLVVTLRVGPLPSVEVRGEPKAIGRSAPVRAAA